MGEDPTEERTREGIIGEIEAHAILIADYDPTWAERFHQEEAKIRKALGQAALAVEQVGYILRVREPDFEEHRMFRTPDKDVHVHVFSAGTGEIGRLLLLRDHLREDEGDRGLYAGTKRELASRDWPSMQHYADAKTEVVEGVLARATAASSREG